MNQKRERYNDERLNKADAELRGYSRQVKDLEHFKARVDERRERCAEPKSALSGGVGGSTNTNHNEDKLIEFLDLSYKLDELYNELDLKYATIYRRLMSVPEPQQTILNYYYLKMWSIVKISQETYYSDVQIKRLKKEGLKMYYDTQ